MVNAFVMPEMVGGNINAAVIMIAEKATDQISGRAALDRLASERSAQKAAIR